MKKIDFKSLFIQNFLSVGNEPLEINFSNGLNVITGINRDEDNIGNGAGKCLDKRTKIKVRVNDEIYKILSKSVRKM